MCFPSSCPCPSISPSSLPCFLPCVTPTHHQHRSTALLFSHLTLINGDLQRWQHHYSSSVATPPRAERNRIQERGTGGKMGSDVAGGTEAPAEGVCLCPEAHLKIPGERRAEVLIRNGGLLTAAGSWRVISSPRILSELHRKGFSLSLHLFRLSNHHFSHLSFPTA